MRFLLYILFCFVFSIAGTIVERLLGLTPLTVVYGAGIPFFIIFKPWRWVK